jgi:glycosyltransferase involved in cell wall biosynthesis
MNNPILSIIIPTKNRYATLLPLLDVLCSFNSNNFEIVIQDNSDSNEEIVNYFDNNKDIRLKYFYCEDKMSIIDNSDLAVNHSTGEYVCFIGDDDGVMPYVVDLVAWMKRNDIKALKAFKPSYYWPDQKSNYLSNDTSGILKYEGFNYSIKKINTKEAFDFTLQKGGTSMKMLPCLYHGIVEREVLDAIFNKCNTYFPGPSPDMANGVALTKFINEYTYVDFPVVISGKSTKSGGGLGVLHKHISKIEERQHLPINTAKDWTDKIPKFWTGPTIWAESVHKAIENCDIATGKNKFNYPYLYASLYVFNYKYRMIIFKNFQHKMFSYNFYISYIDIFFNRAQVFLKNRFSSSVEKYGNVKNIGEATKILNERVDKSKLGFFK